MPNLAELRGSSPVGKLWSELGQAVTTGLRYGWPTVGVKGGHVHGATDDLGFQAVENKVHVHDLHATILHLLGFDHERFTLPLRRPRLPADRRAW